LVPKIRPVKCAGHAGRIITWPVPTVKGVNFAEPSLTVGQKKEVKRFLLLRFSRFCLPDAVELDDDAIWVFGRLFHWASEWGRFRPRTTNVSVAETLRCLLVIVGQVAAPIW